MESHEADLAAGRRAYEGGEWSTAYRHLNRVRSQAPLGMADLSKLSTAAFGSGEIVATLSISEEQFSRLLRNEKPDQAAMCALTLGLMWVLHGDVVIGSGWINRARRLLRSEPETKEHGFLLYLDARLALAAYDSGPAESAAPELMEMGERLGSDALVCLGLVLSGVVNVNEGRCDEGFAQLDEAMLPVLAGNVEPEWAGDIYCTVIQICHQLCDLHRMRAWTDATDRWCQQFGEGMIYSGVCRVHQLQLRSSASSSDELEAELVRSCSDLEAKHSWGAGEAYYELGEFLRVRGRMDEARAAFSRTRELGIDPQPGEALLLVEMGDSGAGWAALCTALNVPDGLARARLLRPAVEMATALGMSEDAGRWCVELEETAATYSSAGFRAWANHARAVLLLAQNKPSDALSLLRMAARTYHDLRSKQEIASVYELMSKAHQRMGQAELAEVNSAAAAKIYLETGAVNGRQHQTRAESPGGLTPREVDVLTHVAAGASNRDVGAALFISEKTVGRHLANIFRKLGVTSRTAAAAWAHDHHLEGGPTRR